MRFTLLSSFALVATAISAGGLGAAPSAGAFHDWDAAYSGSGAKTTPSGFSTSNNADTGAYAGWRRAQFDGPTIASHLAGAAIDDASVFAPLVVNGAGDAPTIGALSATSELLTVRSLSATGSRAPIRPARDASDAWDLLGDVTLNGLTGVPEPTTWALMLVGFAMIGGALRGLLMANRRLARLRADESV